MGREEFWNTLDDACCTANRQHQIEAPEISHGITEMVRELHFDSWDFNSLTAGLRAFHFVERTAAVK